MSKINNDEFEQIIVKLDSFAQAFRNPMSEYQNIVDQKRDIQATIKIFVEQHKKADDFAEKVEIMKNHKGYQNIRLIDAAKGISDQLNF